jgi:hypothetical protein
LEIIQKAVVTIDKQTQVAVGNSQKAALKAGAAIALGSFLLGPAGILLGGVAGVVYAYSTSENFEGYVFLLMKMDPQKRDELVERFLKSLSKEAMTPENLMKMLLQFKNDPSLAIPHLHKAFQGFLAVA